MDITFCLSTDKAAYPIYVMGITKAIEEKIAVAKSRMSGDTKICCTRYGNVMCSRGSVIPLWIDQATAFVMDRVDLAVGTRAEGDTASVPTDYELPPDAVKEAVVNAVAHRDYTSNGFCAGDAVP